MTTHHTAEQSALLKKPAYEAQYNPDLLFPIPRQSKRNEIGIAGTLPFHGFDIWNHYEVSWLNEKGKPVVALAEIIYGCESDHIIESKSMKLYFNSFNNTEFKNLEIVEATVKKDLEQRLSVPVLVQITPLRLLKETNLLVKLEGIYLDELDVACSAYHTDISFLTTENGIVEETLYSDLLKSNCLVTNQPDWCSIQITYQGQKINREGLLKYIVSFRNDNEFHEQCIEKIFMHLMQQCHPSTLTVYGRSTRRGGLDINSIRSTQAIDLKSIRNTRLCRQ